MKIFEYRDGVSCQHRSIALLSAIQCWMDGRDGLIIERQKLETLLSLKKFKNERLEWLREDFSSFFKYQRIIFTQENLHDKFSFLCVSRKNLDFLHDDDFLDLKKALEKSLIFEVDLGLLELPAGRTINNYQQINQALPFLAGSQNYYESVISTYLLLLSQGKILPNSLNAKNSSIDQ